MEVYLERRSNDWMAHAGDRRVWEAGTTIEAALGRFAQSHPEVLRGGQIVCHIDAAHCFNCGSSRPLLEAALHCRVCVSNAEIIASRNLHEKIAQMPEAPLEGDATPGDLPEEHCAS